MLFMMDSVSPLCYYAEFIAKNNQFLILETSPTHSAEISPVNSKSGIRISIFNVQYHYKALAVK
jgi:hypothetical protein